jgi:VCBS repeat-containing protein
VLEDSGAHTVAGFATAISAGPPDEAAQSLTFHVSNDNNALFAAEPALDLVSGNLSYTPVPDANGTATVTVTLSDDGGGNDTSAPQTFEIVVTAVNDEPSFALPANPDELAAQDSGAHTVAGFASGISAGPANESTQTLTFHVSNDNNALFASQPAIEAASGDLTYTPAAGARGSATVSVTLTDDGGTANGGDDTSTTKTFTITVNAPPVAQSQTGANAVAATEDTAVQITLRATDADGDALTFSVVSSPGKGSLVAVGSVVCAGNPSTCTRTLSYMPAPNANGADSFTFTANDGHTDSNTATVEINIAAVNDAPVALNDAYATAEDSPLTIPAPGVLANDSDADGDPLSAVLDTGPAHGSVVVLAIGSFVYTPAANFNGSDSFTYHANDGSASSNVATVTLTVNSVNDVPVAVDDGYSTDEDTPLTIAPPGVLANDSDVEGDPLSAVLNVGPAHGSLTLAADGSFVYTPGANFNGTDSFAYRASDGSTGSNIATVTITVNAVNDAPVAVDGSYSTHEDTPLTIAPAGVLVNDSDVEGDSLSAVLNVGPAHGSLVLLGDGSFVYTPGANFNGSDSFTYHANDGAADSNIATVTLTVNSVNDVPVAADDAYSTSEDTQLAIPVPGVLGNDSDVDGDPLAALLNTGPAHGSLALAADGSFVYTPDANFNGSDSFTYRAGDGSANSNVATVTITVNAVNDAPVAVDDAYSTNEDTPLTVAAPGVLGNDSDVDGDPLAATLVAGPNDGTLTLNAAGSFTYTPNANFNGSDSFTYRAGDGTADSNVATVTISVAAVNDEPGFDLPANPNQLVVQDSGTHTVGGFATNISPGPANEAGQSVTFHVSNDNTAVFSVQPSIDLASGDLTFTPAPGQTGTATVSVFLSDDGGTANGGDDTSATKAFTITVAPPNATPGALSQTGGSGVPAFEDTPVQITLSGTDADGDALTFSIASPPANGTLGNFGPVNCAGAPTSTCTQTVEYTPAPNANGTDSFTFTASDGLATSAPATVEVNVVAVNDAPSFAVPPAAPSVAEDSGTQVVTGFAGAISAGAGNESGQTLTFVVVSNSNPGLFVPVSGLPLLDATTGNLTYTPVANASGTATIEVKLSDNGGFANGGVFESGTQSFTITVTPVNDTPTFALPASPNQTVLEDSAAQTVAGFATGMSAGPVDEGGQTLTFNVSNSNNALFSVQPAIEAATGNLTYTPAANANGSATVTVTLSDNGGGADTSPPQTFEIVVTAVNDEPSFNLPAAPDQVVDQDSGAQTVTGFATAISAGPNEAGQTLTFGVSNNNNALFSVQPAINAATGELTYTPATGAHGSATVSVTLTDNGGTANGGDDTSVTKTFTIRVNAPPVAQGKTGANAVAATEDTAVQIVLSASDADGNALTFSIVTNPSKGTLAPVGSVVCAGTPSTCTRTLSYTPTANANGADSFTFKVNDGRLDSNTASVEINIVAVNDAPSFTKGADQTVLEDSGAQSVAGWATAISPGPADESTQTVSFEITGNTNAALFSAGPAVAANGTLTYTPAANASGTATITIRAHDSGGTANGGVDNSATQTFVINVTAVNDAPLNTVPAALSVNEDTALSFSGANQVSVADVDAGAAAIQVQLGITNGTLTMTTLTGLSFTVGDGTADAAMTFTGTLAAVNSALATLRYDPTLNFPGAAASGTAAFSITSNDQGNTGTGGALSDSDGSTITVNQVNDAPVGGGDSAQTVGNVELFYDLAPGAGVVGTTKTTGSTNGLLDNDSDPVEGSPVSVAGIVGCLDSVAPFDCATVNGGSITVNSNGRFSFRPAAGSTAADSFQYVLTDNGIPVAQNVNVTVNLTFVGNRIWFVKNNSTAGGVGRSSDPFDTLAEAQAVATAANDRVFVYFGDGTTTAQNAGFTFAAANQTLQGQGVALTTGTTVNGVSNATLVPAGSQPLIGNTAGNGVTMGVGSTVTGLSLGGSVNAVDFTSAGASTGTYTITSNTIRSAGAEGIDINLNNVATGALTLAITDNAWNIAGTHTGNAIDINRAAGTLNLNLSGNTNILSTGGSGIVIAGGAVASTTITGFAGNSVHGNTAGAGINISNVTFDSTAGGAIQQVDGDNLPVGASGNPVGGAGVAITSSQGNLFFDDLDVFAATGTALAATGTGTGLTLSVTPAAPDGAGTSTIDADNGAAVDIATTTIDLRLAALDSTTTATGLNLSGAGGQFRAPTGSSISKTSGAGTAFTVANSASGTTVAYGGTLNVTSGAGVSLTNNTGSTISFTNTMTLSTGTNAAFTATGGGTVTVTGPANTLTTSGGTALNVAGTTIGASGLTFVSITSIGGTANGIILDTTGSSGGLTVTGDGTNTAVGGNSTGGTISGKSGADGSTTAGTGIYLNNTINVVLRRMTITGTNQNFGIRGTGVNGFTLEYSTVSGTNGTAASLPSPESYGEGSIFFGNATANGALGNVTLTNNSISGGRARNFSLVNTAPGTTTLTVKGNVFGAMQNFVDGNQSFAVEARVSSGVIINTTFGGTVAGEGNTLTNSVSDLVNFTGQQNTTMDVVMRNNTLSNNNPNNIIGGGSLVLATAGTMTFHVTGNTMRDANGSAVTLFKASPLSGVPSMSGFFANNTIGVLGVTDSGSKTGNGIFVSAGGAGTMSYTITNNQIHQIHGNAHIFADNTGGSYTANFTITGNVLDGAQPPNWFAGIAITNGSPDSPALHDTVNVCAKIGGAAAAEKNTLNLSGNLGVIVGSSGAASGHVFNLPGYSGGANLTNVANFIQGNNLGSFTTDAYADAPATAAAFIGTGPPGNSTSCPTPTS